MASNFMLPAAATNGGGTDAEKEEEDEQLSNILKNPEASVNGRFTAMEMLKKACVSASMVLQACQDTETAICVVLYSTGKKGQFVLTDGRDPESISRGIYNTYTQCNFRYAQIDLNMPMRDVLKQLDSLEVKTRVSLTGTLIVAREIAHAKLKERLDNGEGLPDYFKQHPVIYAGPSKTPEVLGKPSGSIGPTTGARMDPYTDEFQKAGASMVMIAKGNMGNQRVEACKRNGGFYLESVGGIAGTFAQEFFSSIELIEYPELGMEAIYKVENFPAFLVIDNKGNDFFKKWTTD